MSFAVKGIDQWIIKVNIYIPRTMLPLPGGKNRAWIGLKKDANTGKYYWSGDVNSTLEYDMWGPYDANGHTSCILMYEESIPHDFRFGDESCGQAFSVLCWGNRLERNCLSSWILNSWGRWTYQTICTLYATQVSFIFSFPLNAKVQTECPYLSILCTHRNLGCFIFQTTFIIVFNGLKHYCIIFNCACIFQIQ